MTTIRLSERLVERLRRRGITNIENFIETVIERMDDAAIAETHEPIVAASRQEEDVTIWMAELDRAFAEVRKDLTSEELQTVIRLMNEEYIESIESAFWKSDLPEDNE